MKIEKDPLTGKFAKGNTGRPKGTKNMRTLQWEELGKEITEANAGRFNELLGCLWDSPEVNDRVRAAELFLKLAEFFKPKLQRINTPDLNPNKITPPNIILSVVGKEDVKV
jgi:hypothetical protein